MPIRFLPIGGIGCVIDKFLINCLLRWLHKHIRLSVGFLNTAAGYVEVFGLNLDADKLAPHFRAGYAGCAGTHEGIEDGIAVIW